MSDPVRIDCYPRRRFNARLAFALAALTLAPLLAMLAQGHVAASFLLIFPLTFASIGLLFHRGCRRLRVHAEAQQVVIEETHETFARGSVLAVLTRSVLGAVPFKPGPPQDDNVFELLVWTAQAPGARAAPLSKLARDAREPLQEAMYQSARLALGAPDRLLMAFGDAGQVFEAARAVAGTLEVPWLHEGLIGTELRAGETLEAPIVQRPKALPSLVDEHRRAFALAVDANRRMTAEGLCLEWHVSRTLDAITKLAGALLMAGLAIVVLFMGPLGLSVVPGLLGLVLLRVGIHAAAEHGRYRLLINATELIVQRGRGEQRFARGQVRDVEANLAADPSLWIATAHSAIRLPVQGPISALWLAEQISAALVECAAPHALAK